MSDVEALPVPAQPPNLPVSGEHFRTLALQLEALMAQIPGAVFGDSDLCPLTHTFAEGIYVREIFIPAGTVIVGKIHKHAHPNFLLRGTVIVITEEGGSECLIAPLSLISPAGTKRVVMALEDTVWVTVHATTLTDPQAIEAEIIAKNYEEYEAFILERAS